MKYLRKGPEFHASAKLFHLISFGTQMGGKMTVSVYDLSDVEIIHTNGVANAATKRIMPSRFIDFSNGFVIGIFPLPSYR
jgi:hypothetical protein